MKQKTKPTDDQIARGVLVVPPCPPSSGCEHIRIADLTVAEAIQPNTTGVLIVGRVQGQPFMTSETKIKLCHAHRELAIRRAR